MISKQTVKILYNITFILGLVLTIASINKVRWFSYLIGLVVMCFSIIGYQAVNKYYDGFANDQQKKSRLLLKTFRRKRTIRKTG